MHESFLIGTQNSVNILTDLPTPHHINPCNQIFSIMKYGVNRVTLAGVYINCNNGRLHEELKG